MILEFIGNAPRNKYLRVGVSGNNLVDDLVFIISRKQGKVDLYEFNPKIKITTPEGDFAEYSGDDLTSEKNEDRDTIKVTYVLPEKITERGNVDMQIVFEKPLDDGTDKVWQTLPFNVTFPDGIDESDSLIKAYPNIVRELKADTKKAVDDSGNAVDTANAAKLAAESVTAAESERVNTEKARVTAENNRANAETARVLAEDTREDNETSRLNAESARVENEKARASAELKRVEAERKRQNDYEVVKAYVYDELLKKTEIVEINDLSDIPVWGRIIAHSETEYDNPIDSIALIHIVDALPESGELSFEEGRDYAVLYIHNETVWGWINAWLQINIPIVSSREEAVAPSGGLLLYASNIYDLKNQIGKVYGLFDEGIIENEFDGVPVTLYVVDVLPKVGKNFLETNFFGIPIRVYAYFQKLDGKIYGYNLPDYPVEGWVTSTDALGLQVQVINSTGEIVERNIIYVKLPEYSDGLYILSNNKPKIIDQPIFYDVDNLPTNNINENAFYRLKAYQSYTLYNQPFEPEAPDMQVTIDGIVVDELPKIGIPSSISINDLSYKNHIVLYYQKSDNKAYFYVEEGVGDLPITTTLGWNITDISVILVTSEPEEIENRTVYIVYKEKSITKLYYYFEGWHEVGEKAEILTEISLKSSTEGSSKELVITVNDDGEISITEKKTNKVTKIAPFTTDETLSFKNNVLSVNIAQEPAPDNTLPISAAAVATTVGNIEILLKTI